MSKRLIMGNEAIALSAINSGVKVVCGYPGTPSTEVLETVAKHNDGTIHVEWSVNEKAALETATGAAYSGLRTLVTMKQVGLNVASDPLMTLSYLGVVGGMVIVTADDPGPISSQTEQDTRTFGGFSKVPVFDPSSPEEAYAMIPEAFEYSEKYNTPVLFRPTTRVSHACASIDTDSPHTESKAKRGFVKDKSKFVVFPRTSYLNHLKIAEREKSLSEDFSDYERNTVSSAENAKIGIASGGVTYEYLREALEILGKDFSEAFRLFKVTTPYPFPERRALYFLKDLEKVLVLEELDSVIEKNLVYICGKHFKSIQIDGKENGKTPVAGELSTEAVIEILKKYVGMEESLHSESDAPTLPVRPPVLCAGCPHRASFYAVKTAVKALGVKAVMNGDIGCYTLGNAMPLDMVDTCLCMGAGITMAQGIGIANPDTVSFAFVGDSTFFASGMTGVVNSVYNKNDMVLVVLDNSTTAMTGNQPHPGTGKTMMGDISPVVSIEKILRAIGLEFVETVNPFYHKKAVETVKKAIDLRGTRAIIFKAPCIAVSKPTDKCSIDESRCVSCKRCIREIGCPAIVVSDGKVSIEPSLCTGCTLCTELCPTGAISLVSKEAK